MAIVFVPTGESVRLNSFFATSLNPCITKEQSMQVPGINSDIYLGTEVSIYNVDDIEELSGKELIDLKPVDVFDFDLDGLIAT